jgi:hypothetical protein
MADLLPPWRLGPTVAALITVRELGALPRFQHLRQLMAHSKTDHPPLPGYASRLRGPGVLDRPRQAGQHV